jgi:hypothetical protein
VFNHFHQDYPEGEDFVDTLLTGQNIERWETIDQTNLDESR